MIQVPSLRSGSGIFNTNGLEKLNSSKEIKMPLNGQNKARKSFAVM
jgi:hypothetical protein